MKLRVLQILAFIFAATFEVRVHAAQVISLKSDSAPMQEPVGCLETGERCAVKTSSGKKYQLEIGSAKLTLGSGASVVRYSTEKVNLVTGLVLVKSDEQFFIEVEYGKIILKNSEVLIERTVKKSILSVIRGEAFIQPRGQDQMFVVEPGFTNWLGEVDQTGVAQTGIATPVEFENFALTWSSLYDGKKTVFKNDLKEFANVWQKANEQAAAHHKDLAKRRIASLEADYQKRQAILKKKQAYENQLRTLFRRKSLDQ